MKALACALLLALVGLLPSPAAVAMAVEVNGQRFHDGRVARQLVASTGKRHGTAPHPATAAYVQWLSADLALVRAGWNTIRVTLAPAAKAKPLQLAEMEVGVLVEPSANP